MDMIWDQDVRTALSAIIAKEPIENQITDEKIRGHIQQAIRYADELSKVRAVIERRPPVQQYRPQRGMR